MVKKRGDDIYKILKRYPKLVNPRKTRIVGLLSRKRVMNISQIHRALKIPYKETYRHITHLGIAGLLSIKKQGHVKSRPTLVSLKKRRRRK